MLLTQRLGKENWAAERIGRMGRDHRGARGTATQVGTLSDVISFSTAPLKYP